MLNGSTVLDTIKNSLTIPDVITVNKNVVIAFDKDFSVDAVVGIPKATKATSSTFIDFCTPRNCKSKITIYGKHEYSVKGSSKDFLAKYAGKGLSKDVKNWHNRGGKSDNIDDIIILRNPHSFNTCSTEVGGVKNEYIVDKGSFAVWWDDIRGHIDSFNA